MYTVTQIVVTTVIFIVSLSKGAPAFPLIVIAFVPIRLLVMNRLWGRATLRLVDRWACREGGPEDDDDGDDDDPARNGNEEGEGEREGQEQRDGQADRAVRSVNVDMNMNVDEEKGARSESAADNPKVAARERGRKG